eukprot:6178461-Pleurochrysis_carterae.AAC.1
MQSRLEVHARRRIFGTKDAKCHFREKLASEVVNGSRFVPRVEAMQSNRLRKKTRRLRLETKLEGSRRG